MKKITFFVIAIVFTFTLFSQNKLKPLAELLVPENSAWNMVQQWIKEAKNHVEVLPIKNIKTADSALYNAQVTTRSPMGAVIHETGGILIDYGWLRILGSGSQKLNRDLMSWNKGKSFNSISDRASFLLIADDILGGFFAINGGGLDSSGIGKVFYFEPDNLQWDNTDLTYSEFLSFCFSGELQEFYADFRWKDWKNYVSKIDGNSAILFVPFLWSQEGQKDINKNEKKIVSIKELWDTFFSK